MAHIEICNVKKKFKKTIAIDDISLDIKDNEFFVLFGPAGAGKTTTFSIVVGLVEPDEGEVLLDGEPVTGLPMYRRARKGMGYLPQEPSIFRKMTSLENLLAILETLPIPRAEREERARTLLERFKPFNLQGIFCGHWHGFTERKVGEVFAVTNRCCALKRGNHDKTKEKGFLVCEARDGRVTYRFVEAPIPKELEAVAGEPKRPKAGSNSTESKP